MGSAYEAIRAEADTLSVERLKVFSVDVPLARHNVELGIARVEARHAELEALLRGYRPIAPRLKLLLTALEETTREVLLVRPRALGVRKLALPVFSDRQVLVAQLGVWCRVGLVPEHERARLHSGRGVIECAKHVVQIITDLLERYPVVKHKILQSPPELSQMLARARTLLEVLRPLGARRVESLAYREALDAQARVWTLLVEAHEILWSHAALVFRKDVDRHVLPLGSRVVRRKKSRRPPSEGHAPKSTP